MGQIDGFSVVAMGQIACPGGVPAWVGAHPGFAAAITDNGVGDYTATLDGGGVDATESVVLVTVGEAQAANLQITAAAVRPLDTTIRFTVVQETGGGGGASAAYDGALCVLVLGMRSHPVDSQVECIASGSIEFLVPGTPVWREQRGFAAAITDGGVGIATVTLDGGGADATECVVIVSPIETQAASLGIAVGAQQTSDTAKLITCSQEQAAGAPSIMYDGQWTISVWRQKAV